jgi:N-acetylglucosamine kinase-like BadF-type ATPase
MCTAINQAVDRAISNAKINKSQIKAMGFGIAGYDWPSERPLMDQAVKSLEIDAVYDVVNDVEIGLIAGSEKGWGVAVDAGTGNNIRGRSESGIQGRITGSSIHFGEYGGASEMVSLAVIAAAHAWTQRGPKTKISQLLMDFALVSSQDELMEKLATAQVQLNAEIAKGIIRLATDGDPVAQGIVNKSAHELALNTNAVIKQLYFEDQVFDLVMIGSLFQLTELFQKPFADIVKVFAPNANLIHLGVPPVAGAVLLAARMLKISQDAFRRHHIRSVQAFFGENNDI